MHAFGWIIAGRRPPLVSWLGRGRSRLPQRRKLVPSLESLETIDLMSRGGVVLPVAAAAAEMATLTPSSVKISGPVKTTATQSITAVQGAVVPGTLTNFSLPFAPSIQLFDPSLGTLTAVHITTSVSIISVITSQNTSTTSGADITGSTTGNYTISGLSTTISAPPPPFEGTTATVSVPPYSGSGPPDFTGPTTVNFPPLIVNDTRPMVLTSAADLAFFTGSTGRSSITPVLTENAVSTASAPNGNLQTIVFTYGAGSISVAYDYIPRCPAVVRLVRFGVHHQPTQLQLTFDGPLDPAQAQDVNNYRVVVPNKYGSFTGPGVTYVPITSAVYNANSNTVTLTVARRLNVHRLFQLQVSLPCNNGNVITIEFGGKASLGGFTNPHNRNVFIPVTGGKISRPTS